MEKAVAPAVRHFAVQRERFRCCANFAANQRPARRGALARVPPSFHAVLAWHVSPRRPQRLCFRCWGTTEGVWQACEEAGMSTATAVAMMWLASLPAGRKTAVLSPASSSLHFRSNRLSPMAPETYSLQWQSLKNKLQTLHLRPLSWSRSTCCRLLKATPLVRLRHRCNSGRKNAAGVFRSKSGLVTTVMSSPLSPSSSHR